MQRSWIHFARGRFVRQARIGLGELREEHLSRHGFAGPVAMIYRAGGPNEIATSPFCGLKFHGYATATPNL
ncbi:MAG: hypothetical protein ACREFB_17515 [Stellaceae bacterium]